MLSRNQVKYVNSLKLKKQREKQKQFIAEGSKLVLDLLDSDYEVCDIFATGEWIDSHVSTLQSKKIFPTSVTEEELSRITALTTPGPVLAVLSIPERVIKPGSSAGKLILALDEIRDPGNLGTIIRIADWFGISAVICSETTVDFYNPKVVQATMGSIARVPVHYTNLEIFLSGMPASLKIYGSFLDGENIYSTELEKEGIIVIGNESKGISASVAKFVTRKLHIPSFSAVSGACTHAESLNASVATAVLCSEFKRRTNQQADRRTGGQADC
jgi:RNA methyltransferase, TrmH family